MLPDFPEVKDHVMQELMAWVEQKTVEVAPVLSEVSRSVQHEGRHAELRRPDTSVQRIDFENHTTEVAIDRDHLKGDVTEILKQLKGVAEHFAREQQQQMFSKVSEAAEKVGNVVDAQGEPLSWRHTHQVLEEIYLDFDHDTGEPLLPTLVIHPSQAEQLQRSIRESAKDLPEMREAYKRILDKKWREWRDRESNRKLVD